jgi:hypothetical protein
MAGGTREEGGGLMRFFLAGCLVLSAIALSPAFEDSAYLPLEEGSRWDLKSESTGMSMAFQVEGRAGAIYRVRWENPWTKAQFGFESRGDQILLRTLDMGNGVAPMPDGTVYFDFGVGEGKPWSNVTGKLSVVSRDKTVTTPAGRFDHCIEIRATDKGGSNTFWFFAPGTGFVQFGEGSAAFRLISYKRASGASPATAATAVRPAVPATINVTSSTLYLGLESNPTPAEGYEFNAKRESFEMSNRAGANLIFVGPKWSDIEPSPGRYNFGEIDERVKLAESYNASILLNIRIVDTSAKSVPNAYKQWNWDDPQMRQKLTDLIGALGPRLKGRCRWVTIGNEVNEYFSSHRGEIDAYARLMTNLTLTMRSAFPGLPFSVNFTSTAIGDLHGKFQPIVSHVDFYSINYYPIDADFRVRDPGTCGPELQRILDAVSDRPLVFQELGYPSSSALGSSEEKQAQFLTTVFAFLRGNRSKVRAVNFNWRGDLPDSVVRELSSYYKLGDSGNFKEFLATLGWFHKDGTPKKIWYVFQSQAPALISGGS